MSALGPVQGVGPLDESALAGSRRSHLFGNYLSGGTRSAGIAVLSTILVFGVIGFIIVSSPGWAVARQAFFDPDEFAKTVPKVAHAFWLNVQMFVLAEVFVLALALFIAVMRGLRGPAFAPFRIAAIVYTDFFRGVPGVLIVYMFGFGLPSLGLPGIPTDPFFWALVALVLLYSAYVSEVYRAGIDSVHPSQEAAARSLGLSHVQALRFVVLPQAVRRVIPPLLNDFIGLQKDTALLAFIGPVEAFSQASIISAADFNLTPYLVSALFFLALTVPMARFVDWLVARDRRRYLAGAQ
jgi:polar amino acid transport system permease protein